ncbi:MAG: PQQ-like beta-propeller repeat protein [Candidatus Omnitrophica bacterium]|nr:PQQ-like beta-propeller repeat protein [Candidatus Omnitrophota bacterium]
MSLRILFVALILAVSFAAGEAGATAPLWAEYGKNAQNTGQSGFVGPKDTSRTWKTALDYNNGDSFVSPVVSADGTVYLLDNQRMMCQWQYVDGQWQTSNCVGGAFLKAVGRDGAVRWQRDMGQGCIEDYGTSGMALGSNGLLYLMCGGGWSYSGTLYAVNAQSGDSAWMLPLDGAVQAVGNMTVDSQNRIYFASHSEGWPSYHKINAVSPSGELLWSTTLGKAGWSSDDIAGPVLSNDEKVVYVYRFGRGEEDWGETDGYLEAVEVGTGEVKWRLPLEWGGTGWQMATSFAVDKDGTLWFASYVKYGDDSCYGRAENLVGVSPNGYISHKFPLEGDLGCGSHISIGPSGTVYVTYDDPSGWNDWYYWDGEHYLIWSGEQWYYQEWEVVYTDGPAFDGSWYYWNGERYLIWNGEQWYYWKLKRVYTDGPTPPKMGGLAAYDPVNGFKWRFELPDSFEANATPAIDAKENIYFAASFGERLYSINKGGQVNWIFDIAPGTEPTNGWCNPYWGVVCGEDEFIYGVAPVIGLGGSIHVMGSKYLYTIEGVSIETVIASVENFVSTGVLNGGVGNALISKLNEALLAKTDAAKDNIMNAVINQINALEKSGKIDSTDAEELKSMIGQL